MKILKQLFNITLGVTLAFILCIIYSQFISYFYDSPCEFLDSIKGNTMSDMEFMFVMINVILVLGIGSIVYLFLYKKLKNKTRIYFFVITLLSCYKFIEYQSGKIGSEYQKNTKFEITLCDKITGDGMFCKMNDLTALEYNYLNENGFRILELPLGIYDGIDITYFRDGFFNEYDLMINISVSTPLDTLEYPKWKYIETKRKDSILYNYHVFRM